MRYTAAYCRRTPEKGGTVAKTVARSNVQLVTVGDSVKVCVCADECVLHQWD
jgi:hypothetical protein